MSEEKPPAAPPAAIVETPPAEDKDFPAIKKAEEIIQKLDEKEKALNEKEKALDLKIASIDKKISEEKLAGFGQATVEKTQEQKDIEESQKLFADTGLDPFEEPYDAFARKKRE